jgi:mevalonate kinase
LILDKSYSAKVLLFGEYTIINGGQALAMPCHKYSGRFIESPKSNLIPYFEYLKSIKGYDRDRIDAAISSGLSFDATIPLGYGMGSSGAVTAAAFDHFYLEKPSGLPELKTLLGQSENFFHGNSSGLDPLTIYLDKALVVQADHIEVLSDIVLGDRFALIDSGQTRNTKALVTYYQQQLQDPDFSNAVVHLNTLNEQAIDALISNNNNLKSIMAQISHLQFEKFQHMIPDSIAGIWKSGLDSDNYYVKLSGAGGGGYFLVYGNYEEIEDVVVL